jgi:DNA-directed RNA polymerase subunit RPC12/RpoP
MVRRAWEIYDEADIIVGYNTIRFDNRHLKSDWLVAGMSPPAPWKNVDLFTVNKATFGFESKSLQHLCDRLGLPGKSGHYDPAMAERCMAGSEIDQRKMRRYNVGDVKITETAYDALRPWIHNHPHISSNYGADITCNACGSSRLTPLPKPYRANVLEYAAYRCDQCGANVKAGMVRRVARTQGVKA